MLMLVYWSSFFYTSILIKCSQENDPGCNTAKAFYIIAHLFFHSSFSNVVAVSVDRFLAVHLHLRYQALVTHKRIVAVVSLITMGVKCICFFFSVLRSTRYLRTSYNNYYGCWSYSYSHGLHQDLFSCKTAQESDSGPSASSPNWRNS